MDGIGGKVKLRSPSALKRSHCIHGC